MPKLPMHALPRADAAAGARALSSPKVPSPGAPSFVVTLAVSAHEEQGIMSLL